MGAPSNSRSEPEKPKLGRKPNNWSPVDEHYEAVRRAMFTLFEDLKIAA
jgi:hypothetical protein